MDWGIVALVATSLTLCVAVWILIDCWRNKGD